VEDPPGTATPREEIHLVGDPRPGRVDEPEDGQLLAQRHLGGANNLLDSTSAPRAGLDRRVVGDHDRSPALHHSSSGDHAVGRQAGRHRVGVAPVLDEGTFVEEQRDALPHVQLVL